MPAQEIPNLKSQYAEKVTADLEVNTTEQQRIREEITSLQARLGGLEQDHALLVGMRAAIGDTAAAGVPGPRTGKKTAAPTGKAAAASTAAKKTAIKTAAVKNAGVKTAAVKTAAVKTAAVKTAAVKAGGAKKAPVAKTPAAKTATEAKGAAAKKTVAPEGGQAPLAELIHRHLTGQTEPKTAGEIAEALAAEHRDRTLSSNVVRTTTERLVARSQAERVKQGATVYYTALPHTGTPAATPAPQAEEAKLPVTT
ncbi:hypothetical protein ACIRP0_07340 [Streptomyces sp. NPDC101733]|uniref:hypothetical protein n=1 Tax=unclassified Streptomyces TaxID=2593676 RepID=UPI00382594D0